MTMRFLAATALIAFAAFAAQPAKADTVTNGDFATGDFTGWTLSGDTSYDAVGASTNTVDPSGPGFGNSAQLGTNGGTGILSQTLSTTAGVTYDLSFYLQADGGPGTFTTLLDGSQIADLSVSDAGQVDWLLYSYKFTGTGNDTLEFDIANDPSYFELTDVSADISVPEPATWAIMLAGVVGVAYNLRRRGTASPTFA